jgi:hypothetical protein
MANNSLRLSDTDNAVTVIDLTHSPVPARHPRRCSACRNTGHNIRNCPEGAAVHYQGQVFNMYRYPLDNLIHFVSTFLVDQVQVLNTDPVIRQLVNEEIFNYVSNLSTDQLRRRLKNPRPVINYMYHQIFSWINIGIQLGSQQLIDSRPRLFGREYAKHIKIEMKDISSISEPDECFICCDKMCSVKTDCGHDFCSDCITAIINSYKDKTSAPICSFCKTPFAKFTVSQPAVFDTLSEFIENLEE